MLDATLSRGCFGLLALISSPNQEDSIFALFVRQHESK